MAAIGSEGVSPLLGSLATFGAAPVKFDSSGNGGMPE
jgi:hypothetical protein